VAGDGGGEPGAGSERAGLDAVDHQFGGEPAQRAAQSDGGAEAVGRWGVDRSRRSYLSQLEPTVTFGLGKTAKIDSLTITWPDGTV
jgi:hypothetical protein